MVSTMTTASASAGAATSMKGSRQFVAGPSTPATSWPRPMPMPVAIWTSDAIAARWVVGKRSPSSEKTSGKTPPTATPVSIRSTRNCQKRVTWVWGVIGVGGRGGRDG
jgi:hypothetical protein